MLGLESWQVMALRLMKLASGGTVAANEMQRMVAEKIAAAAEESYRIYAGATHASAVKRYRKRVRSNRRRLSGYGG